MENEIEKMDNEILEMEQIKMNLEDDEVESGEKRKREEDKEDSQTFSEKIIQWKRMHVEKNVMLDEDLQKMKMREEMHQDQIKSQKEAIISLNAILERKEHDYDELEIEHQKLQRRLQRRDDVLRADMIKMDKLETMLLKTKEDKDPMKSSLANLMAIRRMDIDITSDEWKARFGHEKLKSIHLAEENRQLEAELREMQTEFTKTLLTAEKLAERQGLELTYETESETEVDYEYEIQPLTDGGAASAESAVQWHDSKVIYSYDMTSEELTNEREEFKE